MNRQALTVEGFMADYSIGRTKVYEEIGSGRLATYNVGRRRFISSRAADEWQRRLEVEASRLDATGDTRPTTSASGRSQV